MLVYVATLSELNCIFERAFQQTFRALAWMVNVDFGCLRVTWMGDIYAGISQWRSGQDRDHVTTSDLNPSNE